MLIRLFLLFCIELVIIIAIFYISHIMALKSRIRICCLYSHLTFFRTIALTIHLMKYNLLLTFIK